MTICYLNTAVLSFSIRTNMLSTDNPSATLENNNVTYPLKDEKPSIKAEDHLLSEQDKTTVDDATAEATLAEPQRFESIANFRDVGLSCTTKDENGLQRYGVVQLHTLCAFFGSN